MIYVGRRYTVRLAGSVLKGAYCENCGCEYVYRLERTAEGQGSSPYYLDNSGAQRRAQEAAARALIVMLRGTDAVPCPDCGWYQSNMFVHLGGKYGWLMAAWITGALAMLICYAIGLEPFLYATAINALFFFLWLILRRAFKPNFRAHERAGKRMRGKPEAILRSILEPKLKELEEADQESLRRAFDEIDAAKTKLAGKFKPGTLEPKAQEAAEDERKRGLRLQLGALAFAEVAALVVIGPVSAWKAEADAYAKVTPTNQYAMERYLREFPNGKHAPEVRDIRDDFHWDTAQSSASSAHASQPLRQYLADGQNTRHREEAKQKLKAAFAEAVQHAEALPRGKGFDADFATGILAALKSQQESDNPIITVSFGPVYTPEPDAQMQAEEHTAKLNLLRDYPELKQELAISPATDRIIPYGDTFEAQAEAQRNRVLIERLQVLMNQATGGQIVSVVEVPKVQQGQTAPAMLTIEYHISPAGDLTSYYRTTHPRVNPTQFSPKGGVTPVLNETATTQTFAGFVRVYQAEWSISFNLKNLEKSSPVKWRTMTGANLNFKFLRNDGESRIYKALLHSSSMSALQIMADKLGLPPQPVPKSYTPDGPAF